MVERLIGRGFNGDCMCNCVFASNCLAFISFLCFLVNLFVVQPIWFLLWFDGGVFLRSISLHVCVRIFLGLFYLSFSSACILQAGIYVFVYVSF